MSDLEKLKTIERIIGSKLTLCSDNKNIMGRGLEGLFCLNDEQQVIGLNLSNCKREVIDCLVGLTSLTTLDLSNNQLSDISALQALTSLTTLDLSNNQLSVISALQALTSLTGLELSRNQLSDISALQALTSLTELYLSNNQLSDISALQALTSLTELDLRKNQLSDISALRTLTSLIMLYLSDNQLKTLPEGLLDLNLDILWEGIIYQNEVILENNPLERPPPEIIKQGTDAIRNYFTQLNKKGTDYLYEAKLILIGEGGAGKTSFANKIINADYTLLPENESESTQGIDILRYQFSYNDTTFHVNIWDFGGQEIYHQTHQFFLSKRSLYCVVADNRKEDTDFYYWLNTVDLFSDNIP